MAKPSLSKLALSGLLYPIYCVEGLITSGIFYGLTHVRKRAVRLYSALVGVVGAGATALFLLRTLEVSQTVLVALSAYVAGGVVAVGSRLILAHMFARTEDAV